jgi:hypothetical protein
LGFARKPDFRRSRGTPFALRPAARPAEWMPAEQLKDRVADLGEALDKLEEAFKAVTTVIGNDGSPLAEVDGVDAQFCTTSRQVLAKIGDELNFWGRTWRRRHEHGQPAIDDADTPADDQEVEDYDDDTDDVTVDAQATAKSGFVLQ